MGNLKVSDCWYHKVCDLCNENCIDSCIRFEEMSFLLEHSNIPKVKQTSIVLTPEDCDYNAFCELAAIKNDIVDFVDSGNNLYICSRHTGNGKTSWSFKLLLKYFDSIWAGNGFRVRAKFINVPLLMSRLKDFSNNSLIKDKEEIINCDLIVWDDVGSVSLSAYDITQLVMIIDERINKGKANIYTSNLVSFEDLARAVGEKLASRIFNMSKVVELKGKDRRNGFVADIK